MRVNPIRLTPGRVAVALLLLLGTGRVCSAQLAPFRQAVVQACLGGRVSAPCDLALDERAVSSGVASINSTYGSTAIQAVLGVNATADASFGVLRSRVSSNFNITGPPTHARGAAFAIFQDVVRVDFEPLRGQTGFLRVRYVLNGNISASGNAHAFVDVKAFVFGQNSSNTQQALIPYTSSVSGLFSFPQPFQFTYGQPFALRFDLVSNCGTLTPTSDPPSGVLLTPGVGRGAGTADFSNTFVLAVLEALDSNGNPLPAPPTFVSASGTRYTTNGVLKSFADLSAKVEIRRAETKLEAKSSFTLGADSDGINPAAEDVTLEVGPFSVTIPAGSFRADKKGRFKFEGYLNNVALEAQIRPLDNNRFEFKAEASGVNLIGTPNPVPVRLIIGDDGGNTTSTADFE